MEKERNQTEHRKRRDWCFWVFIRELCRELSSQTLVYRISTLGRRHCTIHWCKRCEVGIWRRTVAGTLDGLPMTAILMCASSDNDGGKLLCFMVQFCSSACSKRTLLNLDLCCTGCSEILWYVMAILLNCGFARSLVLFGTTHYRSHDAFDKIYDDYLQRFGEINDFASPQVPTPKYMKEKFKARKQERLISQ